MKELKLIVLFLFLFPACAMAQSAESSFHVASNQYIHGKMKEAKSTLADALHTYPKDPKLNALKDKLKDEEKKEQEKKDQEKQEQKDKEKKEQEKKDQEQKEKEKEKKDQDQKDQNKDKKEEEKKDQEKKDQEGKKEEEKKDQQKDKPENDQNQKDEQQKKDEKKIPQDVADKLKQMNISEEKARMILEAMKNQEVQYLQQNKRKATKPREKGKPDW